MKIIVCVDEKNGLSFGGKRQSQDRVLRDRIVDMIGGAKLWMSRYSAAQFAGIPRGTDRLAGTEIIVDDEAAQKAGRDDYYFVEDREFDIDAAEEIIVCRWQRQYPADRFLEVDLRQGFERVGVEEIVGSSHDKITIEKWIRK